MVNEIFLADLIDASKLQLGNVVVLYNIIRNDLDSVKKKKKHTHRTRTGMNDEGLLDKCKLSMSPLVS